MPPKISQIRRIVLNVTDVARSLAFYRDALAFEPAAGGRLRLGGQEIELRHCTGQPYPRPRAANDPWFQHFAILVSDMSAAYNHLLRFSMDPISIGGPQRLPPSSGSVTAFKFRDSDGHPLELSYIPGSRWLDAGQSTGLFLGIDHTAFSAVELNNSIAFYEALGMKVVGRYVNQGLEQDRLDGLTGVELDIVAMTLASGGPHIELLHYRSPSSALAALDGETGDIASTITELTADRLQAAPVDIRDPSGHRLRWVTP